MNSNLHSNIPFPPSSLPVLRVMLSSFSLPPPFLNCFPPATERNDGLTCLDSLLFFFFLFFARQKKEKSRVAHSLSPAAWGPEYGRERGKEPGEAEKKREERGEGAAAFPSFQFPRKKARCRGPSFLPSFLAKVCQQVTN